SISGWYPHIGDRYELTGPQPPLAIQVRRLVLVGIDLTRASHHNRDRAQSVLDANCAGMAGQDVGKPAVGHRAFIQVPTDQGHPTSTQPVVHLGAGEATLGFLAAEQAAGAVYGRVEAGRGLFALDTLKDNGVIAHRAAYEAALT